jgi:hypothetical protein
MSEQCKHALGPTLDVLAARVTESMRSWLVTSIRRLMMSDSSSMEDKGDKAFQRH